MSDIDRSGDAVVTRSEERLDVSVAAVPVRRAVVRKVVVTEERTITVTVRREELRIEEWPLDPAADVPATTAARRPIDLVLHEEQVEVVTRVVPVERVRVTVERRDGERTVTETLRREQVEVDGEPIPAPAPQGRHRG